MKAALSGTLATMCPAVPYALAAKFAYPDRPVIAAIGDGAMQMLGINALDRRRPVPRSAGADPRLVVLVLNNNDLNQVTWEQRVHVRRPQARRLAGRCPDFPYAALRRADRARRASASTRPSRSAGAWDEALAADRPCVDRGHHRPGGAAAAAAHPASSRRRSSRSALPGRPGARRGSSRTSLKGKLEEIVNR